MNLPADFVTSWTCPSLAEILDIVDSMRSSNQPGRLIPIISEIRPVDLYCYLSARFGIPNGIQNLLRNDHSDNLVHWDWTLSCNGGLLAFWGGNFRTDLWVRGDVPLDGVYKDDLIAQIRSDFKNYGPGMSAAKKQLERWTEFVNPHWRLKRAIERLLAELSTLDLESDFSENFNTPLTASQDAERWSATVARYNKAFGLCFGVRSMLPVMAEAFVNLLIFALVRPDIRKDPRLYENLIRQPIDVRVKSLHINCIGFQQPIDYAHQACRHFHSLINERNDLLHGNVSPEKQSFNEVYFRGRVPVFKEYRSLWQRTIAVDSQAVGLDRLKDEVATVGAFREYLLSCLVPEQRDVLRMVSEKRDLARNHEDGRLGVLFPDHLVDSRMDHTGGAEPSAERSEDA
jgi:hypothetical protein